MPNNPVQIVQNSTEYITEVEPAGGGRRKDFFAGRDEAFRQHQTAVISQIDEAREYIAAQGQSVAYAKVRLRSDALAKSHRPTEALFRPEWAPVIGVSDIGDLLIEVSAGSLQNVRNAAEQAEPETRIQPNRAGRDTPHPTRIRSELGAVERFDRYRSDDKRDFSAEQSAAWLASPTAGNLFVLHLFRPMSERASSGTGIGGAATRSEFAAFGRRLASLHPELQLEAPTEWWARSGFAVLPLPNSDGVEPLRTRFLQRVLELLDEEPLVRRVMLPPIIRPESAETIPIERPVAMVWQAPIAEATYPLVGVVDTGVAQIDDLRDWVVDAVDIVDPTNQDQAHGTFIAGLIADGSELNNLEELTERPCKIYDVGIHVTSDFRAASVYPRGFIDLLEQLDAEIAVARRLGVRVYNMSLAAKNKLISDDTYGPFAAKIDDIIDRHDVIMVLPAGNLEDPYLRDEWGDDPNDVLQMLGSYRHADKDRILQPGESLRSITVGALDQRCNSSLSLRPSQYTRRGPGIGLGRKPDLAHIGGAASAVGGLRSFGPVGGYVTRSGTSFAAPLVAKTLANIDHTIEGEAKRETIVALAVHGSTMPTCTTDRLLNTVAGDFVGFGVPARAADLLSTDDNGISLVFESSIGVRQELNFVFQWPEGLVDKSGRCRGSATMTLVYRPPLDPAFGSETVRVNVEACLRQERIDRQTGEIKYKGFFSDSFSSGRERHRIAHGLKWHTVKRWTRTTRHGVGDSSQWKVVVSTLTRQGVQIPAKGIPFSLVLTLCDPFTQVDVFNQMRRSLRARNVQLTDIRTAYRLRT
ncbi:MAG: S8 family peptidase [Chloroflexota bacterium]|nr:S8 family peptidase [Chloroflexota bacterium]